MVCRRGAYTAASPPSDRNEYYYVKNLQNDVIGITDAEGNVVARYYYDAWGNYKGGTISQSARIGYLNPIRYRSYYCDTEFDYYYVNSRYYNPELGRFINADTCYE